MANRRIGYKGKRIEVCKLLILNNKTLLLASWDYRSGASRQLELLLFGRPAS
jgi:hypothetical protein